jgi:hypothetical protein
MCKIICIFYRSMLKLFTKRRSRRQQTNTDLRKWYSGRFCFNWPYFLSFFTAQCHISLASAFYSVIILSFSFSYDPWTVVPDFSLFCARPNVHKNGFTNVLWHWCWKSVPNWPTKLEMTKPSEGNYEWKIQSCYICYYRGLRSYVTSFLVTLSFPTSNLWGDCGEIQ